MKFIHITDSHLLDHPEEVFYGFNTKSSLEKTLSHSINLHPDSDFIFFTGDISQTGNRESYDIFNSVIQQHQIPVYCVPGNHDNPEHLQKIIPSCPRTDINIIRLSNLNLVLINSHVEGEHHGVIHSQCLRQLQEHLDSCNGSFNIIAMHHPPIPVNSKWLDELGLKNQSDLMHIISNHNSKGLLLFGHVHQEVDIELNGLRLLSTPSSCYQFKSNSEQRLHLEPSQPAYRLIEITGENMIRTQVYHIEYS